MVCVLFLCKQKTAYESRISDCSSDVCSSDLVSTNYAALACMDFPTCHGQWLPHMDFEGGYSLIRGLGMLPSGEMISQHALTAIHWTHRNFAFLVFAYLGVLGWKLLRVPGLKGPSQLMLVLLFAQLSE